MKELIKLFKYMVDNGASDLHLQEDTKPYFRIHGWLYRYERGPDIDHAFMERAKDYLFGDYENNQFDERQCSDFAHVIPYVGRLRVSFFTQSNRWGAVFRLIPEVLPSFEQLGLPEIVRTIAKFPRGLVLVVGPTGSGKTTTLATMLDWINHNRNVHILTLEDPIEYKHKNINCIVNQREVGRDVNSFLDGIREGLRQDPDVILVGEMRDLETTAMALMAAETGHLVFGTLHTSGASDTVDRIIDIFPSTQQSQIRTQLALSLRAVVSQVLVRRKDREGRVAIFEVMLMTNSIRNLIREQKVHQIDHVIQSGRKQGMITLEHNIATMVEQGIIDDKLGIELANDPDDLLESLLADATRERIAKKGEVDLVKIRQDFSTVGYDMGRDVEMEEKEQESSNEKNPYIKQQKSQKKKRGLF
jgi:twitching motility protein PilT